MHHSKAGDTGVLSNGKDDNEAVAHFHRVTSLLFKLFDYIILLFNIDCNSCVSAG